MNDTQRFVVHNRTIFPKTPNTKAQSVVLMELNGICSAHIAYSYLGNCLAKKYSARLVAYDPYMQERWRHMIFRNKRAFEMQKEHEVYKSFGISEVIGIRQSRWRNIKAWLLAKKILKTIKTKRDLENLRVHGIWVGDLFYDSFLQKYKQPTVSLTSNQFKIDLCESLENFLFWKDYFRKNMVRAVSVSHCVYNLAIPLRIAIQKKIPVFQANLTHLYKLTNKNPFAYNDFFYFKQKFASLPKKTRLQGLGHAKEQIKKRFMGKIGVDMSYSTKSAYGKINKTKVLKSSNKTKVLIATHCFFDSPHSYGNNLFPDFYEWLKHLGEISKKTNYDWYIKTHPDVLPESKAMIMKFLEANKQINLICETTSHHQIIKEGINFALTVYGTIGFEYAALGIPVINCSLNNPHIAYEFNIHPRSVKEYTKILLNLNKIKHKINKKEVYEYYFMRFLFKTDGLFFRSLLKVIKKTKNLAYHSEPLIYSEWLKEINPMKHKEIINKIEDFLNNKLYRLE